jgi:hypothetical protein
VSTPISTGAEVRVRDLRQVGPAPVAASLSSLWYVREITGVVAAIARTPGAPPAAFTPVSNLRPTGARK